MYPYRSILRIRLNWADDTKTESSGPTSTASGWPSPAAPRRPPGPSRGDPVAGRDPGDLPAPQGTVEPGFDGRRDVGGEQPDQDPVLRCLRVGRAGLRVRTRR